MTFSAEDILEEFAEAQHYGNATALTLADHDRRDLLRLTQAEESQRQRGYRRSGQKAVYAKTDYERRRDALNAKARAERAATRALRQSRLAWNPPKAPPVPLRVKA